MSVSKETDELKFVRTVHSDLRVHRADQGDRPVDTVTIRIGVPLPELSQLGLDGLKTLYDGDADLVVDALFASLPAGTLERVVAKMILRHASLYAGPITNREVG